MGVGAIPDVSRETPLAPRSRLSPRRAADVTVGSAKPEHGRRERRSIRVSSELNGSPTFPGVGQVFAVRRETREVKSGKRRTETACGVTSPAPEAATQERLLTLNRGHWTIEAKFPEGWKIRRSPAASLPRLLPGRIPHPDCPGYCCWMLVLLRDQLLPDNPSATFHTFPSTHSTVPTMWASSARRV